MWFWFCATPLRIAYYLKGVIYLQFGNHCSTSWATRPRSRWMLNYGRTVPVFLASIHYQWLQNCKYCVKTLSVNIRGASFATSRHKRVWNTWKKTRKVFEDRGNRSTWIYLRATQTYSIGARNRYMEPGTRPGGHHRHPPHWVLASKDLSQPLICKRKYSSASMQCFWYMSIDSFDDVIGGRGWRWSSRVM